MVIEQTLGFLEEEILHVTWFDFWLFIRIADGDAGKKLQGVAVFHCICDDLRVSAEGFQIQRSQPEGGGHQHHVLGSEN